MVPNSAKDGYLRDEVKDLLRYCERIHHNHPKSRERDMIEQETAGRFKAQTLKRKYELFVYGGCKKRCADGVCRCPANMRFAPGDWRGLVDYARMPGGGFDAQRFATVQFYVTLCEREQRNSYRAWEKFCAAARAIRDHGRAVLSFGNGGRETRTSIPGLDVRDPARWNAKGEFPIGCSYEQLTRSAKQVGFDDYTAKLARVGRFAASKFRLKVYTDRSQLPFFARLQHDDHEDNTKLKWPDSLKFLRPRGFYSLEQLSGSVFQHVLKPTLWDLDEGKKKALALVDFQNHLLSIFFGVGYRRDEVGTENVIEHGTATAPEWLVESLYNASEGHIRFILGGRFGKRAHDGQYDPSTPGHGKGNPLFKAQMESFFNLRDNWFASLAGQVGKDREHCPEQLAGVEREARAMVLAAAKMSPEQAALIKWQLPSWVDYTEVNNAIMSLIDGDRHHALAGWGKFTTRVWRTTSDPHDPASQQWLEWDHPARAEHEWKFTQDAALTRDVRMSRREVFQRGRGQLTKLPWRLLPVVLRPEDCLINHQSEDDTLAVDQGVISFRNQYWGGETLRFHALDAHGRRLFNGERYRCYGVPFLPEAIVACDAQNRFVGVCPKIESIHPLDRVALEKAWGRQAAWEAETRMELNIRHEAEARHIQEVREHNAHVVAAAGRGAPAARPQANGNPLAPRSPEELKQQRERLAEEAEMAAALRQKIS